jgi:signal peptidase I
MNLLNLITSARLGVWPRLPNKTALGQGRHLALMLAAATLTGLMIHRFLVCAVIVHGQSMAPNFSDGQLCLVHKAGGEVNRGDVVIVDDGQGQTIKRVVGLPTESLLFRNGKVYVNGRELHEDYLPRHANTYPVFETRFTLDATNLFVMGDNRFHSEDSRVYGPIRRSCILGKVMETSGAQTQPREAGQMLSQTRIPPSRR